VIKGVDK